MAKLYRPDWNSIGVHQTPEWLKDAKYSKGGRACQVTFRRTQEGSAWHFLRC